MNYIGSKLKLSNFIKTVILETVGENLSEKVFCELFAGTGIVGRTFKADVKKVIANDFEYYSYVLNRNYIGNSVAIPNKEDYLCTLNQLEGREGFIYTNYCMGSGSGRQYFSDSNGKKIDAARLQIKDWKNKGIITYGIRLWCISQKIKNNSSKRNSCSTCKFYPYSE